MTQGSPNQRPFAIPVVKRGIYTSGNFMLTRAPWQSPVNKYYVIRKLIATNMQTGFNVSSGGIIMSLWDQDLSNTTPVARGSGGQPLLVVPVGGASGTAAIGMTSLSNAQLPQEFFQAGITMTSTPANISGIAISVELEAV